MEWCGMRERGREGGRVWKGEDIELGRGWTRKMVTK